MLYYLLPLAGREVQWKPEARMIENSTENFVQYGNFIASHLIIDSLSALPDFASVAYRIAVSLNGKNWFF